MATRRSASPLDDMIDRRQPGGADALDPGSRQAASAIAPPLDPGGIVDGLDNIVVFRLLVRSAATASGDLRFPYVSQAMQRIFGLDPHALAADAAGWRDMISPLDCALLMDRLSKASEANAPLDMELAFDIPLGPFAGRHTFRITARAAHDGDGAVIWDGALAEVPRNAERARLMEVIEVSPDLIGTVNAAGRVVYLNRAGHEMLGLDWSSDPHAQMVEIGIEALHPPEMQEHYWNEIVPSVKRDGVWVGDTRIVNRYGQEIPVSQVVVAHRGPDGRPGPITHLSTIVRDMRTRTELEDSLRAARRASETARDAAEMARAHAENMTHEVNHRVKNLFSLVPAIVQLSARSTDDVNRLVVLVRERIAALVRSHDLTLNENGELAGVSLRDLLLTVLQPYEGAAVAVDLDGPDVRINAADGNALSLVLHELATNAAKYGALSTATGALSIGWQVGPRTDLASSQVAERDPDEADSRWTLLTLTWQERSSGRPPLPIEPPEHSGSGTLLLDRLVRAQQGTVEREWASEGLTVRLRLPVHGARGPATAPGFNPSRVKPMRSGPRSDQ